MTSRGFKGKKPRQVLGHDVGWFSKKKTGLRPLRLGWFSGKTRQVLGHDVGWFSEKRQVRGHYVGWFSEETRWVD